MNKSAPENAVTKMLAGAIADFLLGSLRVIDAYPKDLLVFQYMLRIPEGSDPEC